MVFNGILFLFPVQVHGGVKMTAVQSVELRAFHDVKSNKIKLSEYRIKSIARCYNYIKFYYDEASGYTPVFFVTK